MKFLKQLFRKKRWVIANIHRITKPFEIIETHGFSSGYMSYDIVEKREGLKDVIVEGYSIRLNTPIDEETIEYYKNAKEGSFDHTYQEIIK